MTKWKLNVHLVDMRNSDGTGYQPFYVGDSGVQVGGSNSSYIYINFVPTLNTWYHLCVKSNSSRTQLFVNGEYYGETTSAKATNFNKKIDIHLGSRYSGSNWFGGNVSDFRLYNEYLSNYEIRDIAKGLLLHYTTPRATTQIGGYIGDSSGFNRNGIVSNGIVQMAGLGAPGVPYARYYWGYSLSGSSPGSCISLTSPSSNTKTISFWLYRLHNRLGKLQKLY